MKRTLEYILFRAFAFVLRLLPFTFLSALGATIGKSAFYCIPIRKKVSLYNIRKAFPEKSDSECSEICRNAYRNFGRYFFETIRLHGIPRERLEKFVSIENTEILDELLAQGKGVIGVTGHFGNVELLGVSIGRWGYPIDIISKPPSNKRVEDIMDKWRSESPLNFIKKKEGVSAFRESLANKRMLTMISDQDAGKDGVFVDFFGIPSSTAPGLAVFALRSKAPVYSAFIINEDSRNYRIEIRRISTDDLSGKPQEKIKMLLQRFADDLEEYVRKYPDHYFWMHKKWKSAGLYKDL
ncbi:MAG: lysophospholipid acyltransferase family protein [bacterium]|nr:lysophospholipid acyltransferase family protein [bacterium]